MAQAGGYVDYLAAMLDRVMADWRFLEPRRTRRSSRVISSRLGSLFSTSARCTRVPTGRGCETAAVETLHSPVSAMPGGCDAPIWRRAGEGAEIGLYRRGCGRSRHEPLATPPCRTPS